MRRLFNIMTIVGAVYATLVAIISMATSDLNVWIYTACSTSIFLGMSLATVIVVKSKWKIEDGKLSVESEIDTSEKN